MCSWNQLNTKKNSKEEIIVRFCNKCIVIVKHVTEERTVRIRLSWTFFCLKVAMDLAQYNKRFSANVAFRPYTKPKKKLGSAKQLRVYNKIHTEVRLLKLERTIVEYIIEKQSDFLNNIFNNLVIIINMKNMNVQQWYNLKEKYFENTFRAQIQATIKQT